VSAAVARGGRMVFSGAVGLADVERAEPATSETVYNIGSVSKEITAVAVMQLVGAGKVRLADPIQRYVPGFPDKGSPITVWHLLTHTSGIRHYRIHDFPGADWEENHRPYASLAEAIGIFKDDPLLFRPGKYYFYSSYGVNLLQGVVETASGLPFGEYLRRRVFNAAAMTRTGLDLAGRPVAHRAHGYKWKQGKLVPAPSVDVSYKYASGGMISTAEDLVRLGMALNQGKLLTPAARARMLSPQLPVVRRFREDGPPATERFQQGLEWRLVHRPHRRDFVYGCGTFNGFNACLLDYTGEDLVVAMALNREAGGFKPAEALADLFRAPPPA
jgi:serine beta-lactamase-like protein LACTB, mitochondrial